MCLGLRLLATDRHSKADCRNHATCLGAGFNPLILDEPSSCAAPRGHQASCLLCSTAHTQHHYLAPRHVAAHQSHDKPAETILVNHDILHVVIVPAYIYSECARVPCERLTDNGGWRTHQTLQRHRRMPAAENAPQVVGYAAKCRSHLGQALSCGHPFSTTTQNHAQPRNTTPTYQPRHLGASHQHGRLTSTEQVCEEQEVSKVHTPRAFRPHALVGHKG